MKSLKSLDEQEEGKDQTGGGLELMKQRYQLEDADRRAFLKNSLLAFQHYEEERKRLIKDIKEAREQLRKQKFSATGAPAAMTTQGFFRATESKDLVRQKKMLNERRNETTYKMKQLKKLRAKMEELRNERSALGSDNNPLMQTIRQLENKLDKAMIKYNEAMSIRKTYEMIVKRLQDERVGYDNQLAAIEKNLRGKEHDYEELLLLEHDAKYAQKEEEDKLAECRKKQTQYEECKKNEFLKQKTVLTKMYQQQKKMEEREREELERKDEIKRKQFEQSKRRNDSEQKKQETNLDKMKEELQHFKKAFQEIKEVTGVGDVNDVSEVIQKFMTQDDTLNGLKTIKDEKSRKLEALNNEREELKEKVNKYKYEGAEGISKKQAEEVEKNKVASQAKLDRYIDKYNRINQIVIDVRAGIEHLYENTKIVKIEGQSIPCITEDTVVEALAQCEQKLIALYTSMKGNPELMQILETKDFSRIEKKQAAAVSTGFVKRMDVSAGAEELDVSDREQKEEMAQQINERNKLKHEALTRHEKKLKLKAKKPKTAVGQRRGFF